MTRNEIYSKLVPIFCDVLFAEDLVLNDETTAEDVEGWDSLNHVNLIVAIEQVFRIKVTTRDAQRLRNVGELVDMIARKTA